MNSKSLLEVFGIAHAFVRDTDWWLALQLNCGEDAVAKMLVSVDGAATSGVAYAADALVAVAGLMRDQGLLRQAQTLLDAASELKRAHDATVSRGQLV